MAKLPRVLLATFLLCLCHSAAARQAEGGAPAGLAGLGGSTSGLGQNALQIPAMPTDQHLPDGGFDNILLAQPFTALPAQETQGGQAIPDHQQTNPLADLTHKVRMPDGQTTNPDDGSGNGTIETPVGTPPPAAAPCPSGSHGTPCPAATPVQHQATQQAHPPQTQQQ